MNGNEIEEIWNNAVVANEGKTFYTGSKLPFEYKILDDGKNVRTTRTDFKIPKANFEKAIERMPLTAPKQIKDLRGYSYIYGILTGNCTPD